MLLSITRLELDSYLKLIAFFKLNGQIVKQLKQSKCKQHKITGNSSLKVWYTMTLWENESDLNDFYRHGTHLETMKQAKKFSSNLQSTRIVGDELIDWKVAKKMFVKK